jgi:hypothetical protein
MSGKGAAVVMKIRRLFRLPSAPSDALIAWMRDPGHPAGATALSLSGVRDTRPGDRTPEAWEEEQFFKRIEASLRGEGGPFAVVINVGVEAGRELKIVGPDAPSDSYIQSLGVEVGSLTLTLSNMSIKDLYVNASAVNLRLNNCNIRSLRVQLSRNADIRLAKSNVGTLEIQGNSIGYYEMQGGSLLNVACPPPESDNPFSGTVSFTPDVFFPRERDRYVLPGPQPYRNLRFHLRALENAQMANLIHSAELAVERQDDTWTNRRISQLYEWMSDFGSSALRPFLWLLLLYVSSVYAIFCSDGAEVSDRSALVGWQHDLIDPAWGEYTRAFYLALQSFVNPVGIFGPKYLLVPKSTLLAAWLSVHGFLSLILLALLIFAIRRRFKIQA